MAKIRKYKLNWNASESVTVAGYKLYWAQNAEVSYDSNFIDVGNVTEIELPDDVNLLEGPVMFGVTAVDCDGNESDMTTLSKPLQLDLPKAPTAIFISYSKNFKVLDSKETVDEQLDSDAQIIEAIETDAYEQQTRMKFYDDVG